MTKEKKVFQHQPDHWVNKPSVSAITDERLDYFDRCLLMYMCYRFDYFKDVLKKAVFLKAHKLLADVFNVHRNTVSKAIQTLKTVGYIDIQVKKGSSNTYTKVTTWLNGVVPTGEVIKRSGSVKTRNDKYCKVKRVTPPPKNYWHNLDDDDDSDIPF